MSNILLTPELIRQVADWSEQNGICWNGTDPPWTSLRKKAESVERKKVEPWERVREALSTSGRPAISDDACRRAAAAATEGLLSPDAITDAIERVAAHRETIPADGAYHLGYSTVMAKAIQLLRKELGL